MSTNVVNIPVHVTPDAAIHLTGRARETLRNMRNKVLDAELAAQGWGPEAAAEAAKVRASYSRALETILDVGFGPEVKVFASDPLSLELSYKGGFLMGVTWMENSQDWYCHS